MLRRVQNGFPIQLTGFKPVPVKTREDRGFSWFLRFSEIILRQKNVVPEVPSDYFGTEMDFSTPKKKIKIALDLHIVRYVAIAAMLAPPIFYDGYDGSPDGITGIDG